MSTRITNHTDNASLAASITCNEDGSITALPASGQTVDFPASGLSIAGVPVTKSAAELNGMNTTKAAGVSTVAAGSTTADAGVLPAATASIYPTTAADDTKGVRVHASDKVTGRILKIGNGVSNKILKVYAPSGGTINGGSADAAFSSVSGKGVEIYCLDATANSWLAW